ncbi:hypothetical protein WJX77_006767 [Trebouxia sp. C0004]
MIQCIYLESQTGKWSYLGLQTTLQAQTVSITAAIVRVRRTRTYHTGRFCGTIRPGFVPLCASTMRTTALDNKHAKDKGCLCRFSQSRMDLRATDYCP